MNISNTYLLLLLQIIKGNGDIKTLLEGGLDYSQIAKMISNAKDEGLINSEGGVLTVSGKGIEFINEVNHKLGRYQADAWISPEYSMQRDDILDDITYLPKRKKIKKLF